VSSLHSGGEGLLIVWSVLIHCTVFFVFNPGTSDCILGLFLVSKSLVEKEINLLHIGECGRVGLMVSLRSFVAKMVNFGL
jgi:hypothetical protein